jgi:hypothetical protein
MTRLDEMISLQKEFRRIKQGGGLISVDDGQVHVDNNFYREELLNEAYEHAYEKHSGYIRVTCDVDGTKFLALFTPTIRGEAKDLI